ncbi:MAG: SCO family protein [Gammaproteobacteria bacterium]|nr:SCO family protein [Gammaproteobacteria bacterium]
MIRSTTGGQIPLILCLLAGLLVTAGCDRAVTRLQTEDAFVLPQTQAVTGLELTHAQRGKYGTDDAEGRWSLLFFGYAGCPDVCPTELYMMAEMMRAIERDPARVAQSPQVVFVSVDPQRDAPAALQQYAAFYHPSFLGVTADQPVVDRLAKSMGVFYERVYYRGGEILRLEPGQAVPAELENSYLINHSAAIYLLDPDARLHAIFTPPHDPMAMIRDLAAIQQRWEDS